MSSTMDSSKLTTASSVSPSSLPEHASNESPSKKKKSVDKRLGEKTTLKAADASEYPEGGAKAWLTVFGAFCVFLITFGWLQSAGVYQAYYELNQLRNYTHDEVAWIVSLQAYCLFGGGLIVGPLIDRFGPRVLLWGGTFLHSFGLFMTSLADEYYQIILAQGLCSGMGTAMLFYPTVSCVLSWFHKKRGSAVGLAASGAGLGGIFFSLIVREMSADVSFGWTMRTSAFLVLFHGIVACLTITSRVPPAPKKVAKDDLKACFKDTTYCLVVVSGAASFSSVWIVLTFIVSTAISRGVDASWSFYLVPILNAASVFGRIIPGFLADRYTGIFTMFLLMSIFSLISMTCVWIPVSGQGGMIVFSVLFGLASGALNALSPVCVAQVSDLKTMGLRTGLCYSVTGLGCLFLSPAGGAIIEHSGYRAMQGFASAVSGLSIMLVFFTRWTLVGFDVRTKV